MNLIRKKRNCEVAQGMLEYVLLVGIIVATLLAMSNAIKRGTQSLIQVAADEIGLQQNADQKVNNETGYINFQNAVTQQNAEKRIVERVGILNYISNDSSTTTTQTLSNGGFTRDE